VCEKVGEQIWPNYALEVFAVLEENINSLVLTYSPGVCVFPAHSGFTPGWVYVHVGGGAVCLISPLEDNLKMASRGQNMQLSSIVIKTSYLT